MIDLSSLIVNTNNVKTKIMDVIGYVSSITMSIADLTVNIGANLGCKLSSHAAILRSSFNISVFDRSW